MNLRTLKANLYHASYRRLRPFYYRFLFGRRTPFTTMVGERIAAWESATRRGDAPADRQVWETQFGSGKWAFMANLDQIAHYGVLVGYLRHLKPEGVILDVGCGPGILWQFLGAGNYGSYTGIDLSETAIARLLPQQDAHTHFLQADAETFTLAERFDAIVFCETLYYFHDPVAVFQKYSAALNPGGVILVSTYALSQRAMAILNRLKASYPLLDEVTVRHGAKEWVCSVFAVSSEQ